MTDTPDDEVKLPEDFRPENISVPLTQKRPLKVHGRMQQRVERVSETILSLVKAGVPPLRAAEACDVGRGAYYDWIRRGRREKDRIENGEEPDPKEAPYMEFMDGIIKAESESMSTLVLSWFKEARGGDWKAAERFLAKRFPQEWGDNNTVKVEVGMQGQVEKPKMLSLEEDEKRKRAVLQALVDAGDLPSNVLEAWDGESEEPVIIEAREVEKKPDEQS